MRRPCRGQQSKDPDGWQFSVRSEGRVFELIAAKHHPLGRIEFVVGPVELHGNVVVFGNAHRPTIALCSEGVSTTEMLHTALDELRLQLQSQIGIRRVCVTARRELMRRRHNCGGD